MGDLIGKQSVIDTLIPLLNEHGDMYFAGRIMGAVNNIPTAFDLESVIAELEETSKYMQSEANDLASVGDYGMATKLEGMSQAYKDCVNIFKSATNATNEKIGG